MGLFDKLFGKSKTDGAQPTRDPNALPDDVFDAITALSGKGDTFAGAGKYEDALREYGAAWELLPLPKEHWNASTWLLGAIADASFMRGDHTAAREAIEHAFRGCPEALGNPFLHLRLGQILFDADDKDAAADQLMRAYMGAGDDIFETEDDKYFDFLQTRADGI